MPLRKYGTRSRTLDEKTMEPRQFIIDVDSVQRQILQQEDTDGDSQITGML